MNAATVLPHLPTEEIFNKNVFREIVHSIYPDCSEASINWMLVTLRKQGSLASAGTGKYYRIAQDMPAKKQYSYPHSEEYLELEKDITESYPLVNFQMWELIQMNDFVNHQIAKNVVFVEVEAMLVDTVYELLHEKYPYTIQPLISFINSELPKQISSSKGFFQKHHRRMQIIPVLLRRYSWICYQKNCQET